MDERSLIVAFEQHITTSVVAITHAFSARVGKPQREQVERLRRYGAGGYRGFPLQGEETWALQRIRVGGVDKTGRPGNQLVHTVFVPRPVLEAAWFDTGLLLSQIPFVDGYEGAGGPVLPPLPVRLDLRDDPAPLSRLCAAIGREGVLCMLEHTLAAFSRADPRPLYLVPTVGEMDPLEPLRALLWLLPAGYRRQAAFWVNATGAEGTEGKIVLLAPSVRVKGHLRGKVLEFPLGSHGHADDLPPHPYPRLLARALQAGSPEPFLRLRDFLSLLDVPGSNEAVAAFQRYWEDCQAGFPSMSTYVEDAEGLLPWATGERIRRFLEGEVRTAFGEREVRPPLSPWVRLFRLWSGLLSDPEPPAESFADYLLRAERLFEAVLAQAPGELAEMAAAFDRLPGASRNASLLSLIRRQAGPWRLLGETGRTAGWTVRVWEGAARALVPFMDAVRAAPPAESGELFDRSWELIRHMAAIAPSSEAVHSFLTSASLALLEGFPGERARRIWGMLDDHLSAQRFAYYVALLSADPRWWQGTEEHPETARLLKLPERYLRQLLRSLWRQCLDRQVFGGSALRLFLDLYARSKAAGDLVVEEAIFALPPRCSGSWMTTWDRDLLQQKGFLGALASLGRHAGWGELDFPEVAIQEELLRLGRVAEREPRDHPPRVALEQFPRLKGRLTPARKWAFYRGLLQLAKPLDGLALEHAPLIWSYLIADAADSAGDGIYRELLACIGREVQGDTDLQRLAGAIGNPRKVRMEAYGLSHALIDAAGHRPERLHDLFSGWLGDILSGRDEKLVRKIAGYVNGLKRSMPPGAVRVWQDRLNALYLPHPRWSLFSVLQRR